jgi:hypothetical protein
VKVNLENGDRKYGEKGECMKRTALKAFALLSISLAVGTAAARAQDRLEVNIPFNFMIGKSSLPAGVYEVKSVTAGSGAIQVRSSDCKSGVIFLTTGVSASREVAPKMVFLRYGTRYFLNQIWMDGSGDGRQLHKTRFEAELALRENGEQEIVRAAQLR